MRILLVNQTARVHTGGTHRMVVESSEWLQRAGHEVAVACWDGQPGEVSCPVLPLPATEAIEPMRLAMQKTVSAFRPEVIQLHLTENDYFFSEVGKLVPACRFIHDQAWFCSGGDRMSGNYTPCHRPHGWSCLFWHYAQRCGGKDPRGNWERWNFVGRKQALKVAGGIRIQVASDFMRRGLLENGYPAERIDVLPLFANLPTTTAVTEPGLMVAACRLVKSKGMAHLIQAVANLKNQPCRLAIAGEGPQRKELEGLAASLGLNERVTFLGEISPAALDNWYARASLVVSPTLRQEPFGLIGAEAMAHGKPVVAYIGGATEEWLADGETGIMVRERSPQALSRALESLLSQPERARQMGVQARARWERFRPETYVKLAALSFEKCRTEFQHEPNVS